MHYLMNKDTPVLEIETAKVLNYTSIPFSLKITDISYNKVYNWLMHRALPMTRKNADKIYMTLGLSRDNQELELLYATHALSINDNYWIADDRELGKLKYKDINIFTNSLNKSLYLVALKGNTNFTITDKNISAEYTGQGTYPKCFIRKEDGIYLYKNGTYNEIVNEIYAAYIAKILGFKSVEYRYETLDCLDCSVSKIVTGLNENWESAFIVSESCYENNGIIPQDFALSRYTIDYSNMIIFDAIILNDDRHMKNWSFSISVDDSNIQGIAHSYDYNRAFQANYKTMSNLIFNGNRKLNLLSAAKYAYLNYGTSLNLELLYNNIDNINININKKSLRNRILYIIGKINNQNNCY